MIKMILLQESWKCCNNQEKQNGVDWWCRVGSHHKSTVFYVITIIKTSPSIHSSLSITITITVAACNQSFNHESTYCLLTLWSIKVASVFSRAPSPPYFIIVSLVVVRHSTGTQDVSLLTAGSVPFLDNNHEVDSSNYQMSYLVLHTRSPLLVTIDPLWLQSHHGHT